ncbi:hypothetical protein [Desertivirga arenae]|uniref:hypothetical protein n=1 Tax=Desertivirga arenae TaxID=2810309 RepID=UPI001A961461|nr:hypothetical protein [Pedobacter sp. SYSU D00823]
MTNSINFNTQTLTITAGNFMVTLDYQARGHSGIDPVTRLLVLDKDNVGQGSIMIAISDKDGGEKRFLISGITGGLYLHTTEEYCKACSVKLIDDTLIMSLGIKFLAFDLTTGDVKWILQPDPASLFEFYELEDDFLLRGEMEIHRIDINGSLLWSFSGKDIWVNIDGEKEVRIGDNCIFLTDFQGNKYTIDFNGETIPPNQTLADNDEKSS